MTAPRSRLDSRPRLPWFGAGAAVSFVLGGLVLLVYGVPGAAASRWDTPSPAGVVEVDVVARVEAPGQPAAWSARARIASTAAPPPAALAPGVCRHVGEVVAPSDGQVADRVALRGPLQADLRWDSAARSWVTEGPHTVLDPAFGLGDIALQVGGAQVVAADAVRFGGLPALTAVGRSLEGEVRLAWDPRSVEDVQISVAGPAGALECGVGAAAVTLPWWAVPAVGGEVVLRTTRETVTTLANGVSLVIRATIERVVPLDQPADSLGAPARGPDAELEGRPARPSSRQPRPVFG